MKIKHIAAIAAAMVAGTAFAQSNVTLYGVIDTGLRYDTNADGMGNKATYINAGTLSNSRFGIKGMEDLGGGMKAGFQLESGFAVGNGSQDGISFIGNANRLFNRTAKVGLEGAFGSLYFGRQYSVLFNIMDMYEPTDFLNVQSYSDGATVVPTNYFVDGIRVDNNIYYMGTFGPVGVHVSYAPGGVPGSNSAGAHESIGLSYDDNVLKLGAVFNRTVSNGNGQGTAPFGTFANSNASTNNTDTYSLGGAYIFGPVKGMLGYAYNKVGLATSQSWNQNTIFGGLVYSVTPVIDVTAAYYRHKLNAASSGVVGAKDGKADVYVLVADYKLSKRTDLYAEYDYTRTGSKDGLQNAYFDSSSANVLSGGSPSNSRSGVTIGVRHVF